MSVNVAAVSKAASTYQASAGNPYTKSRGSGWLFSQSKPVHKANASTAGTTIEAALPVKAVLSGERKVSRRSDWPCHERRGFVADEVAFSAVGASDDDSADGGALSAGEVSVSGSILAVRGHGAQRSRRAGRRSLSACAGSDCRFSHNNAASARIAATDTSNVASTDGP